MRALVSNRSQLAWVWTGGGARVRIGALVGERMVGICHGMRDVRTFAGLNQRRRAWRRQVRREAFPRVGSRP